MASSTSFKIYKNALILSALVAAGQAQQIGTSTAEVHPALTWQQCAAGGSCTTKNGKVVLDANWRWLHNVGGYTNCYDGNKWNTAICNDNVGCAQKCALDGADYTGTYGITASGNSLKLGFKTGSNVGSRTYLMADDNTYQMFNLLNQEFTFDVDTSNLPCGLNGALYFVSMDADGGKSKQPNNKAGAAYGTGYCDSQCPRDLKFIGGEANIEGWGASANNGNTGTGGHGSCCSEMDIWEANSISEALTPHPCETIGQLTCSGDDCGGAGSSDRYGGSCDPDGCDFNPYRMGNTSFYGPGKTIDTSKKLTVVTQFITNDGTSTGTLSEIRRFYVQNGVTYAQPNSNIAGISGNSITPGFCDAQKSVFGDQPVFQNKGGLAQMGRAFSQGGMVLVMSLWDDYAVNMLWLDSTFPVGSTAVGAARGSCPTTSGNPTDVESQSPNSYVIYSNIKVGPIGSTFNPPPGGPGGSTTTSRGGQTTTPVRPTTTSTRVVTTPVTTTGRATTTTGRATTTTAANQPAQTHYGQCGGQTWGGPFVCASPYTCKYSNPYYSQCL